MIAPDDERRLLHRACRGDAAAYGSLVRAHQDTAFRTALLFTGSAADAEEAVQDAFLKAWRALPRFREGAPLRPWLLTIVANEAKSKRRGAARRVAWAVRAAEVDPPATVAPGADAAVLDRERRALLLAAVATLPDHHRLAVELRCLVGLSEAETAAVLGVRAGTVKSRLSRAFDALREEVARS